MKPVTVSVVVVSRARPNALVRCLTGLSQLRYPAFEIIVVTDPDSVQKIATLGIADTLKVVTFDRPNISTARNIGIAAAAGDVVAFIDDDAVPEPSWLKFLCAPFAHKQVAAIGGFVRGRNGISFQWQAQTIGVDGHSTALDVDTDRPTVCQPNRSFAVKTQGTNMAFRRSVLVAMGGFDPAFAYFLDEADLNVRLTMAGYATAIAPRAQVHHGFHANDSRTERRVPKDLFEIGASWSVFLRKHCPLPLRDTVWKDHQNAEKRRALQHMINGELNPQDVRFLMRRLRDGYAAGAARPVEKLPPIASAGTPFQPFACARPQDSRLISGRVWQARTLRTKAAEMARQGHVVTLMLLSPTALFHRVQFHPGGYWEHRGGLFGKSDRDSRLFRLWSFRRRIQAETDTIKGLRMLT
jgi:GT2 family glycosyltransferase